MKKIALVSSLKSTATANYFLKAFQDLGCLVFVISDVPHPLANVVVSGAVDLPEILKKNHFQPDLALFIEGGTMQLFPQGLEKMSCMTAWYGIDTHMDYAKHLRIAHLFDVTFIAQQEYVAKLVADGIPQVFWLPLAFEPSLHPAGNLERIYDIGYVGSDNAQMHPVRHRILKNLSNHFSKMWKGMTSPQEMGVIYAQSKLVFNKSVNNDLNMRYFEAMGAGAVLMTDPIQNNGVEQLFDGGKHFLRYDSESDALELAKTVLADPERLQQIGQQARDEVLAKHTYLHRVKTLLEILPNYRKLDKPSLENYFPVYMALGMSVDALAIVSKVLRSNPKGRREKLVNLTLAIAIDMILLPARLITGLYQRLRSR
ncbi:glycosyltransferase [Polynucleobacter sp. MWH-Braz-FAM2G]|uniref:CgeB family protein n=1 Tax=Polynucleobacter sp. MWH-Braz-FAM2G TaxID=1855883 RepID=UPI001BFD4362|nr:glycosyltransferase [Polynucleobacter sp. MWH-Braz-FAM2G]QWD91072.1 glycosyltransferase [Polynucleobacter sp. MWH-Braz-FAM2G]